MADLVKAIWTRFLQSIKNKALELHLWELVVNAIKANSDEISVKLHILESKDLIFIEVSDNSRSKIPIEIIPRHGLEIFINACETADGYAKFKQNEIGATITGEMKISRHGKPNMAEIEDAFKTMALTNLGVLFKFNIKTDDGETQIDV